MWKGTMARQQKLLSAKRDELGLMPGIHMV